MDQDFELSSSDEGKEKLSWHYVWIEALANPRTETYRELAQAKNANIKTALIWFYVSALIASIIFVVLSWIFILPRLPELFGEVPDFPGAENLFQIGVAGNFFEQFFYTPVTAAYSTVGFAITTLVINWVANGFHGKGTLDELFFAYAACSAPLGLINAFLSPIPIIGVVMVILIGLYKFFLSVQVVRAIKSLSWGKSILVVFIPMVVSLIFSGCILFGLFSMLSSMGGVL